MTDRRKPLIVNLGETDTDTTLSRGGDKAVDRLTAREITFIETT